MRSTLLLKLEEESAKLVGQAGQSSTLRDQLQWDSAVRGMNVGRIQLGDLQDLRGQSLAGSLQQNRFPFAEGYRWQLAPNGTKTAQQRRAGVLSMTVLPEADRHRDPLRLLHRFLQVRCCPMIGTWYSAILGTHTCCPPSLQMHMSM